jgi:transposase
MSKRKRPAAKAADETFSAHADGMTLRSWTVGALPIINGILDRMQLESFLEKHLAADGPRMEIPTRRGLRLLIQNILLSREPIYGLGEWAQRHAPDLTGIATSKLKHLNDDRIGRGLDRLFDGLSSSLVMSVVRHVIQEFELSLEELHNDSTTVTFQGAYDGAYQEGLKRGFPTLGITWGHNKDHRPDLKQLLYILTVTDDGGVPIYFTTASGNTADDQTHLETWELMRQLVGRSDFLYVADCKLASTANLRTIDSRGGRFVTVLPRTRREDKQFRQRVTEAPHAIRWNDLYEVLDDDGHVLDQFRVAAEPFRTSDGFRLLWFFSQRKKDHDAVTRANQLEKIRHELNKLCTRLQSPKTRFRTREKVQEAVDKILSASPAGRVIDVKVQEQPLESFTQATPGRPGPNTQYVKRIETRYDLTTDLDLQRLADALATDGIFPLITNADEMSAEEVLRAYKRQPLIEKRFSQFKHDFEVAPVYLKDVSRIQALLCAYFFVLLVQTLLERELRQAMVREKVDDLPLYPEGRACAAPTTRRVIDLFEPIQRHELKRDRSVEVFVTKLSAVQRKVLKLLRLKPECYGK